MFQSCVWSAVLAMQEMGLVLFVCKDIATLDLLSMLPISILLFLLIGLRP